MKKTNTVFLLVCGALCALTLGCASSGAKGEGFVGSYFWGAFNDVESGGSSRISLIQDVEMIDGEAVMTYNVAGEITDKYQYGYAGWYAVPDDETREVLRKAKSFSFKTIGDGQTYFVMVSTTDIEDSAFYRTTFTARKDQVTEVHVNVNTMDQPSDWGIRKRFNQDLAGQLQWQTTNNGKPGTFELKIWDVRLYE